MRGRAAKMIIGLGVLLTIGSCGGGKGGSDSTTTSPPTAAPTKAAVLTHVLTLSQLKSALLNLNDLPTGYIAMAPETAPPGVNGGCPQLAAASAGPAGKKATAVFQSSKTAVTATALEEDLVGSTLAGSRAYFNESAAALKKCGELHYTDNNLTLKIRLTGENFQNLGNRTIAVRLSGTLSESGTSTTAPLSGEIILIQDGFVDIEIDNLRFVLPEDASLTRQATAKAMAKVARIGG